MNVDNNMPVGEVVAKWPAAARVFARHQIDFCCGGGKSLAAACAAKDVAVDVVVADIQAAETPSDEPDWSSMSLEQMCDELERRYHRPLDEELPRLQGLADKVARVHGSRHPELLELAAVYRALHQELSAHMLKEERILFPMIRRTGMAPPPPIRVMRHEHDNAGDSLRRMRALTSDYRLPEDACNSYQALFSGLSALEHDLHMHIHVENNMLFPRASR